MPPEKETLTPKQVRAGRALLAWSQQTLAKKAGVGPSTVADFERGQRTPVPNNSEAIRTALEQAGVSFPAGGAVSGPPIRGLGQRPSGGLPIHRIDITDLTQWADRRDGQSGLPALISYLARASASVMVHFPSDDAVLHPGWDGITSSRVKTDYVPKGKTAWEIGTQRTDIAGKANRDYDKRTAKPAPLVPAQSTFTFVTPRPWAAGKKWAQAKKKEGVWKDVRVYDGTDLVHWLESEPVVAEWLARHIGKLPAGVHLLEEVWREWSLATQWPLTPELVLSDRDKQAADLLEWLRSEEPTTLALQGETPQEVAAFAFAAIGQLPPDNAGHYLARALVIADPDAARALSDSKSRLFMILMEPEPGLAENIAQKGHYVLMAYGANSNHRVRISKLERPSRDGIKVALLESGMTEVKAKRLARESQRSLAILRRLLPSQASRVPDWAKSAPPKPLIAALLAGAWDERSEADKAVLSSLANMAYDEIATGIAPYAGLLESPLRKVGPTWKVASPQDAWLLLAPYLSPPDIDRFEKVVMDVFGAADPRYQMDSEERWYAALEGVKPQYSSYLRQGLSEILIMLALFGEHAHLVPHANVRPEAIVRTLLDGADGERWWSLSDDFRLLAEAAPAAFLDAVDHSLDQTDLPIKILFAEDETPMFSEQHLSDLLWALESLAWSPDYLGRVAGTLARLDMLDTGKSKWINRPATSLRQMFVFWLPQTYATTKERERILDRLRKDYPVQAWKLMMGILPGHHDTLDPAMETRWRDFSPETKENPTWAGVPQLIENLLTDVGTNAKKWETVLDRLSSFPDRPRIIRQLREAVDTINDDADAERLWHDLRKLLHHNREFQDAQWALPEENLDQLQEIYDSLEPTEPLARYGWIFDYGASLPNPTGDWNANAEQLTLTRNKLAPRLLSQYGPDLIFAIARQVEFARDLGFALVAGGVAESELDQLLERSLKSASAKERHLGYGLVAMKIHQAPDDHKFIEDLMARVLAQGWGAEAVQTILSAIPANRWAWDLAHSAGEEAEREYWKRMEVFKLNLPDNDLCAAIEHLVAVGRARSAAHFAGHIMRGGKIPSELLARVLLEAVQQPFDKDHDRNEPTMFQHYVTEILSRLDQDPDFDRNIILTLEWAYLPLLEYSRRPAKVITDELARSPELFVTLISAIWKPSEDSGYIDPETADPEHAEKLASHAYRLLHNWSVIPGTQPDGTIDAKELEDWVNKARKLAQEKGRLNPADLRIGEVLSASPVGEDGIWPSLPIRDLIERGVRSKRIESGFEIGRRNRRGVTVRSPRDGGQQERDQASWYRAMAKKTNVDWPRLSGILEDIAKSYEHDAGWHDEDVERLDW